MNASLIEMVELLNFGHIIAFEIAFDSRDKILLVTP